GQPAGGQGVTGPTGPAGGGAGGGVTSVFSDAAFRLSAAADATRGLAFAASGISANTTRTLTAPNADATIVGTDTAQSLSNKTLLAASAAVSPLLVRAAASQTAALAAFTSSAGAELLRMHADEAANLWIGKSAGASAAPSLASQTGLENTAVGAEALVANADGSGNVAAGASALRFATGSGNVGVGRKAGYALETGSRNIVIGDQAEVPDAAGDGQLSIGNLIYGAGMDGTGQTASGGNVGIGRSDPAYRLDVAGAIRSTDLFGGGPVSANDAGALIRGASDAALKQRIEPLADGMALVAGLRPVRFDWTAAAGMGERRQVGLIAQEVAAVVPEVIGRRADGMLTVDYAALAAPLVGAVQALAGEVASLRREVEEVRRAAAGGSPGDGAR
ncbi:MAG: tail fiber domain-containing protein, partial [Chloroflexota bacterium]